MSEITTATVLMMIVVCGVVWGGFATLLWRAIRREKAKQANDGCAST